MDDKINDLLKNTADIALRRRAKWIIKKLNPQDGDQILDLGCGDGFYLYLLFNLDLDMRLFGLDYDKNALNSAKKNLNINKIKLIQADLMKQLPFPNDYFDGIIMSEVMEHLPDDVKCMKEARRVLKKNGKLVLSVPHVGYPFLWDPINWILQRTLKTHIRKGFWAGIWNQHLRLYSKDSLKDVLEKSGFKDIKVTKLTRFCLPFNHQLVNLGARVLASKKTANMFKQNLSKFVKLNHTHKTDFNPFWLINLFDRLEDVWEDDGSAVSLVALCIK